MNKLLSAKNVTLLFVIAVLLFQFGIINAQVKYDVKLMINEKVLFKNCIEDDSKLYVSMEELALKIDGSITIEAPYKIGPYFKFDKSKVSIIKTGAGKFAELKIKNTGILTPEVKIIILDGKKHTFLPFEEFVSAVGGTWKYDESTGIYGVTVGGCGACLIDEQ